MPPLHLALCPERREGCTGLKTERAAGTGAWTVLGRAVLQKKSARLVIGRRTKGPSSAAMITSPPNDWLWRYWLGGYNNHGPYRGSTHVALPLLSCPFRLQGLLTRHPPGSIGVDTAARGYPRPWRGEALASPRGSRPPRVDALAPWRPASTSLAGRHSFDHCWYQKHIFYCVTSSSLPPRIVAISSMDSPRATTLSNAPSESPSRLQYTSRPESPAGSISNCNEKHHLHKFKSYRLVGEYGGPFGYTSNLYLLLLITFQRHRYEQPWRGDKRMRVTRYNGWVIWGLVLVSAILSAYYCFAAYSSVPKHQVSSILRHM